MSISTIIVLVQKVNVKITSQKRKCKNVNIDYSKPHRIKRLNTNSKMKLDKCKNLKVILKRINVEHLKLKKEISKINELNPALEMDSYPEIQKTLKLIHVNIPEEIFPMGLPNYDLLDDQGPIVKDETFKQIAQDEQNEHLEQVEQIKQIEQVEQIEQSKELKKDESKLEKEENMEIVESPLEVKDCESIKPELQENKPTEAMSKELTSEERKEIAKAQFLAAKKRLKANKVKVPKIPETAQQNITPMNSTLPQDDPNSIVHEEQNDVQDEIMDEIENLAPIDSSTSQDCISEHETKLEQIMDSEKNLQKNQSVIELENQKDNQNTEGNA